MNYRSIFEQLIKHTSKYSFGKREKEKFAADATRALKLFKSLREMLGGIEKFPFCVPFNQS